MTTMRRAMAATVMLVAAGVGVGVGLFPAGWAAQDVKPAAEPPQAIQAWRTKLRAGDDDWNWTHLWGKTLGPARAIELVNGARRYPATLLRTGYAWYWPADTLHWGFQIADATPPGNYRLYLGGTDAGVDIEVMPPRPKLPVTTLNPGATVDDFETAMAKGHVVLNPGRYVWPRRAGLTSDRDVFGYGAHIFRTANGDYRERLFIPEDNVRFYGVTFHPIWVLAAWDSGRGRGMTFRDCTFAGGQTGNWEQVDCLFQDCTFEHAGILATSGMWFRCRVNGPSDFHGFHSENGHRRAVIDLEMRNTDRGLNIRNGWGSNSDNLYVRVSFERVWGIANGCELVNFEGNPKGPGCDRNLFLNLRATSSPGEINFYNAPARDNLFYDGYFENSGGVCFYGQSGAVQTGNQFRDYEFRGGRLSFAPTATNNTFTQCAWLGDNGRANQFDGRAFRYANRATVAAVGDKAATNVLEGCTVRGTVNGVTVK